ncbi:hypothetical protein HOQ54_gp47 [uncultured phage MedDCM-OCT-S46-C10]|uniref:Uncharacterized protein n=1 Tax=uncultured phage MedDCM-OCT-S46-C10 TaxID=2741074 RepID=A0A6S4PGN6_9CAUD|nr:hypothetical protein HOQ54_gp47 [uncultured phage_MedDCM-OCT-S46-C10]BAQ94333.1 hypothetical protein [uncultured phage_MedDCM-OCT-S46-C10]
MCSPEAQFALAVASKVQEFNAKQDEANRVRQSNAVAVANANRAMSDDLGQVDYEKGKAKEELTRSKFKTKLEKIAQMSEMLNLNVGNTDAILKDNGAEFDMDFMENKSAFNNDMVSLNRKELEVFATNSRTINSLPVPSDPSKMALAIGVAEASANYGSTDPNDRKFFR